MVETERWEKVQNPIPAFVAVGGGGDCKKRRFEIM